MNVILLHVGKSIIITRTLGSSVSNCHGKEMNNEVCVLLPDFNCISCEEISDACMCLNANGYCLLSG